MEIPELAYVVFDTSLILGVGALALLFSKQIKLLPYPVLIFLFGLGLSFFSVDLLVSISLDPELILFIFLPILLFESAYQFDFKEFKNVLSPSSLLATVGLLIAFGVISGSLILLGFDSITALLFGAVISSTDPIAVLSIFKHIGIPRKLLLLIDSESFLNDASSIILFRVLLSILGIVGTIGSDVSPLQIAGTTVLNLVYILIASGIIGAFIGWTYSEVVSLIKNNASIEISLSIISALLSFAIAEALFEASGILAVLICGLIIGNYGSSKISPRVRHNLAETFELGGFLATSFVFFLIGYTINTTNLAETFFVSLLVAGVVFIARSLSVYLTLISLNKFSESKLPASWLHIINLSGIRGALPIVLILSLPESLIQKNDILTLTTFVVLVSLVANSLLIKMLLYSVNLHKLKTREQVQHSMIQYILYAKILGRSKTMEVIKEISIEEHTDLNTQISKKIAARKEEDKIILNHIGKKSFSEFYMQELQKYSLHIEHKTYFNLYSNNIIPGNLYDKLTASLTDQISHIVKGEDFLRQRTTVTTKIEKLNKPGVSLQGLVKKYFGYTEEDSMKSILLYYKSRIIGDKQVISALTEIQSLRISSEISSNISILIDHYNDLLEYNIEVIELIKKDYPETYKSLENLVCDVEMEDLTDSLKADLDSLHIFSDSAINSVRAPRVE